jgi:hypothetical protein
LDRNYLVSFRNTKLHSRIIPTKDKLATRCLSFGDDKYLIRIRNSIKDAEGAIVIYD